jgi:hypothetical protein
MNLTEELEKHAADCEQMAELTRDSASKVQWQDLAKRFRKCAERTMLPTKSENEALH